MRYPFPGMDPWLERPSLWPDVHNSLIAAFRDALAPQVAPRYYVALERRTYLVEPDDLVLVGRPDVAVVAHSPPVDTEGRPRPAQAIDVDVALEDEVGENFLEVRETGNAEAVTVVELLSPANKLHPKGREDYERKRRHLIHSLTSLVEIDLLRAGRPMPLARKPPPSDYRVLVSRGFTRPKAQLWTFDLREPIPAIPVPLRKGEEEAHLPINDLLQALYERARFDLRLRYDGAPEPPLAEAEAAWARELVARAFR